VFSNKQLIVVVAFTFILQLALLYVPILQGTFKTMPLSTPDLALTLLVSTVVFWAIELQKLFNAPRTGARKLAGG
jgi:Ca2+-transporting ATPase